MNKPSYVTLPIGLFGLYIFCFHVHLWMAAQNQGETNKQNKLTHTHKNTWNGNGKEIFVRRYLLQLHLLSSRYLVLALFRAMFRVSPELCNSLILPACVQFSYFTHVPCEWVFQDEMDKSVTFLNVCDSLTSLVCLHNTQAPLLGKGQSSLYGPSRETPKNPILFTLLKISCEPWDAKYKVRKKNLLHRRKMKRKSTSFSDCCTLVNIVLNKAMEGSLCWFSL